MKVQHSTLMHQDIRGTYTTGIVKSRVFISAILFACTAVNSPLHASELENAEDSSGGETIEKIVVSARKKAGTESIQEVPMAITAVSGDVIDKRFFADLTDVANIAPNVNLSPAGTTPGTANFFIRGMGVFGSIPSDETSVGVIQDGLYLGVNSGALTTLFDVESVEVLRGPQGTLFGRNVTGGAVVVNSRRPSADTRAKVRARVGNYGQKSVDVAVGGALSEDDNWLGRLVVGTQSNDDYFDNVNPNVPDRGEAETHFVRPSLTYVANEDLSITLIGEYNKFKGDGVISKNVSLLDTLKDHEVDSDIDNKAEYTVKHLITDVDWTVGEGNIRVIAGWRDTEVLGELDGDGASNPIPKVHSNGPWTTNQQQQSLEIRYYTPLGDMADNTTGIYLFDQEIEYIESRVLNLGYPADVNVGAGAELEHYSYALFSQSDIFISDDVTLTVGGRYTFEEKDAKVASFGQCDEVGRNCNFAFDEKKDWSFVSGNLGIKWKVEDNVQVFTSWTRSFRSGGYNLRNSLPASPGPYDEEQVDALELGLKSDWLDDSLRFNASIFSNSYKDLQRTIIVSSDTGVAQFKANAADATINGLELELSYSITENFRIDASAGFIDAEYDKFESDQLNPDIENVDLQLANVPETSGNLSFVYYKDVADGSIETRLSASYTDSQFGDVKNDQSIELDSYTLIDASIAYVFAQDSMRVSLYGKNLTDEEYTNFALGGLNSLWAIAPPLTYGLEFTYEY